MDENTHGYFLKQLLCKRYFKIVFSFVLSLYSIQTLHLPPSHNNVKTMSCEKVRKSLTQK